MDIFCFQEIFTRRLLFKHIIFGLESLFLLDTAINNSLNSKTLEEKVTLKELARILGVSIATVSKALNDNYDISEETKERIRAKAKEMNYVPNVIAQSLKLKRTFNLGVVIPNITDYFFARALRGITKEAKENKFKVVISISNEELQNEVDSVNLLLNSRVDGILMSLSSETQLLEQYNHLKKVIQNEIPLVLFDRVTDAVKCDKVTIDDYKSAYDATFFLIRKGCRNIAFLSSIYKTSVCALRKQGYSQALSDSKLNIGKPVFVDVLPDDTVEERISEFLESHKIDAILAAEEHSAVASLHVVQNLGYKVPQDISVIGFTNGAFNKYTIPALTSINQHSETMGRTATKLLINRLNKSKPKTDFEHVIIQTDLMERKSTK